MQNLGRTVAIGGLTSVFGQLVSHVLSVLGLNPALNNPITMICMGLLGFLLSVSGISRNLEKASSMGVCIPISGMVIAISNVANDTTQETRSIKQGLKAGVMLPAFVLGTGTCVAFFISTFSAVASFPVFIAGSSSSSNLPEQVPLAFIVGGGLACIAQIIVDTLKIPIPKILIGGMGIGALFALFNIDALPIFTNAGYNVSILSAGQAVYEAVQLLFLEHNPAAVLTVACVFLIIISTGLMAGFITYKKQKRHSN